MSHLCSRLVYPEGCVVFAREGASLKRICMRRRFGRCELIPTYSQNMYDLQYDLLQIPRLMAMNLYYEFNFSNQRPIKSSNICTFGPGDVWLRFANCSGVWSGSIMESTSYFFANPRSPVDSRSKQSPVVSLLNLTTCSVRSASSGWRYPGRSFTRFLLPRLLIVR